MQLSLSTWVTILLCAFTSLVLLILYRLHKSVLLIPGIHCVYNHPLLGSWPRLISHYRQSHLYHDFKLDEALEAEQKGGECVQRVGPGRKVVEVFTPRMVQYILKDNFDNFEKGARYHGIFSELLGKGIFNSDGERWRTTRKIASHMFSASKLNQFMLDTFLKHAITLDHVLEKEMKLQTNDSTRFFDLQDYFLRYTIDSICEIGFGINLGSLTATSPPPFSRAFDLVQEVTAWRFLGPPMRYKIEKFLNIRGEKVVHEYMPIIDEFVYGIIKTRRENAEMYQEAGDLLSLFISDHAKNNSMNTEMDAKELRDLILNFMIAGRDTTAALLTWFFYEVSRRDEIKEKLREEINNVFGETSQQQQLNEEGHDISCVEGITDITLKRSIYLEATLLETLRLHPSVAADSKVSIKDCTFPDGSVVPAKTTCAWSPYTMGRLKSIWGEDANEFKPERWLSEPPDAVTGYRTLLQKSPFAFPQFNGGFRMCLGKSMAIMESKVVAIVILRKFQFEVQPNLDPMYKLNVVLFMKNGLPVRVQLHKE